MPTTTELNPRILVFGIGGAGGNAVNNMITAQLEGVEFVVANTDAQSLAQALTENRIQLGITMTQGLGAGSRPDIGRDAAEEAMDQIVERLQGCHMCFITAGFGGGTGTGAAPIVARAARELGILTVGVVTKPFQFEGAHRMAIADCGIEELQHYVDTLISIPNQNLFRIANEKTTFADAFKMADDVLHAGVRGVTDLMVMPGLINLDFADVRTVMGEMGKAMMGTGEASGEDRALQAAESAISNPLLDDVSLKGAKGVLINITGGPDLTLYEVDEAANKIRNEVDIDANIIVGSTFSETIEGAMRVSVVATGIDAEELELDQPSLVAAPRLRAVESKSAERVSAGAADGVFDPQPVVAFGGTDSAPPAPVVASSAASQVAMASGAVGAVALDSAPAAAMEPQAVAQPEPESAVLRRAEPDRAEAPFIAPRPVRPASRREPTRAPDPFQEAALVNRPPNDAPRPTKREPSLFERITGTGRARANPSEVDTGGDQPAAPTSSRQQAATRGTDGRHTKPQPATGTAAGTDPRPPAAATPGTTEPDHQLVAPGRDEPNLDIPAFLRRQAN